MLQAAPFTSGMPTSLSTDARGRNPEWKNFGQVLFGPGMVEQGTEGGEIDFLTFLDAVNRAQLDTFINSEQGQVRLFLVLRVTISAAVGPLRAVSNT